MSTDVIILIVTGVVLIAAFGYVYIRNQMQNDELDESSPEEQ
jgi:hypothetical protein